MEDRYFNKVVVVTGGASGIGYQLAKIFAEYKAQVIIIDRKQDSLDKLNGEFSKLNLQVITMACDLADVDQTKHLFELINSQHEALDCIVNCAGIFAGGEIRDTPIDDWHKVVQNNIQAVFNATHYSYQIMLKQRKGQIVNIGSTAGLIAIPAMGIYGASKYAISGFTQALRTEAKDFGIKVNLVCPTIVDTSLYDTAIYNRVDFKRALKRRQKFQSPEQAAKAILKGVSRNKATIHTSRVTYVAWLAYRLSPRLYEVAARRAIRRYRQRLRVQ